MSARTDEADLRGRLKDLRAATERVAGRMDPDVLAAVGSTLESAGQRLDLGVDHTVVALLGGTGSGKSSLFNAVARLNFADVGVRRPTTARTTACAWSEHADALLDWLEVEPERRINRISALDGDSEAALAGLVLLDLPDHDSVATVHRDVVDRVLPLADLLVWVVDPQKYADDALHSGYLQQMAGAEASMVVVLNQIDTVPQSQRAEILADVASLLTFDGLGAVDVLGVSALTGEGVEDLRVRLATAVSQQSVAARRLSGELGRAGERLAGHLSADVPCALDAQVAAATDALARTVGLEARSQTAALTLDDGARAASDPQVDRAAVEPVRAAWLTDVGRSLGPRWREELERGVAGPDVLAASATAAVAAVRLDPGPSRAVRTSRTVMVLAGVLALLGIGAGLTLLLGWVGDGGTSPGAYVLGGAAALGLVSGVAALVRSRARRQESQRRRTVYLERGRGRLARVVDELLRGPTSSVLRDHHDARVLALAAVEQTTTADR